MSTRGFQYGLGRKFKRRGVPTQFVEIGPSLEFYAHSNLDAPGSAQIAEAFLLNDR